MELNLTTQTIRSLPVQYIETPDGIMLKRGCTEIRIAGEGAGDVVQAILAASSGEGTTREEIYDLFGEPSRPSIETLLDQLIARRLLITDDGTLATGAPITRNGNGNGSAEHATEESNLEVFYWNFGEGEVSVTKKLEARHVAIIGVNNISRQMAASLRASGMTNVDVIDFAQLRNIRLFDDNGGLLAEEWPAGTTRPIPYRDWAADLDPESVDCIVATADFGGLQLMRQWNEFCVRHNRHFLPVVLQDLIGYVGPFVVPGQTACFECLRARQNANLDDPGSQRIAEAAAFNGQKVVGFHPSMASVLGDIAAIELTKFYGGWARSQSVSTVIEVNLLITQLDARKVLRVPRCPVCSTLNRRATHSSDRNIFMPGNQPSE